MNDARMWFGKPGADGWHEDWVDVGTVDSFDAMMEPEVPEGIDFSAAVKEIHDEIVIDTKVKPSNVDAMIEFMKKYISTAVNMEQERFIHQIMVVGTRGVAHTHPEKRPWSTSPAEHARARKLYSERLRRDRRRRRTGRKPILRTGPKFQAMFPRMQVQDVQQRGEQLGMRMVSSPFVDAGTAVVMDTGIMHRHFDQTPPVIYPLKDAAREYITRRFPLYDDPFKITKVDPS